ncbi:Epimerase domain-containing protein [Mycena kentingensis (nom. inval.)]|nr:Epimerase domain-containing protein [Mycena kentingensis (nom. inval.)]
MQSEALLVAKKVAFLAEAFAKYPQFEAIEIADIATADYTDAFKGVGDIIHTAAPVPGRADAETALRSAIDGSLRVLREGRKAGIKKVVVTGSIVSYPEGLFGVNDWVAITKEQALAGNAFALYIAEKKFGEQAVLQFADEHPDMDITISPGFEHIAPTPEGVSTFSSNGFIYQLLRPDNTNYAYSPGSIDVRDVARIHIAALNTTVPKDARPRRVPLVSPYQTDFREALKYLYDERPELRARLADPETAPRWTTYTLPIDLKPVEEAFGYKISGFKTWKETVLDAIDRFVKIEDSWTSKGFKFEIPREPPV